jgi:WD40 repeat protein/transcriptional regulator with XRE-family HTH domain
VQLSYDPELAMDDASSTETFRGLVLRHRGRTGLIQRDLAARTGVSRNSIQDWESGLSYPTAERLQGLIRALLETGGLAAGREAWEARELWAAAEREAPRMHTPFDEEWFARLLAAHAAPTLGPASDALQTAVAVEPGPDAVERAQDWGEAPDIMGFVGRADELALLRRWVLEERCRLVAILGMGGIGKTSLVARLAQDVAPSFERVYWRSLRDAPPVSEWLAGAIGFLSDQRLVPPSAESEGIVTLLQLLREQSCLLVLDNSETLFEPGQQEGRYRAGMAGYGRVLQAVGEASHQSCLVLTSREAPPELAVLGGDAIRSFELGGLGVDEAQVLLAPTRLEGTGLQWAELTARFGGNGLALKVVGETIRELFVGDIGAFLEGGSDGSVFGGIRRLLTEQVERSSELEQKLLRLLAVDREPVSLGQILGELGPSVGRGVVLEAVEALRRRSLVERAETPGAPAFTLQSLLMEYVIDHLVEDVADEIALNQPALLVELPLIKAQAKDYVRQTQERMIGSPILEQLKTKYDQAGTEQRLLTLLGGWRGRSEAEQGFGPGNVVSLLRVLRGDLRGADLSQLVIRQVYLAETEAQDASVANAQLDNAVLAEAFDFPVSVAISGDDAVLAVGTSSGQICVWRVSDRTPLWASRGPAGVVWSVACSADGQLVVSSGPDGAVRMWEARTGRRLTTLHGHTGAVRAVALSADGRVVASGAEDGTVRLWDAIAERSLATLRSHAGGVRGVALSADGRLLASGGTDGVLRLWDATAMRPRATIHGHTDGIWGVTLSANGELVASSGADGAVRLWDTETSEPLSTFHRETGGVWGVALSADGQLIASGGEDRTVRLWDTRTGQPSATFSGHAGGIRGVTLSANGRLVASCSTDGTVRLREVGTRRSVATLVGYTGGIWGVALSADGHLLASGGADGTVTLWQTGTGHPVANLRGHTGGVRGVALSADGGLLASASTDGMVRLWETRTAQQCGILQGHAVGVHGVAMSSDGSVLASGSFDGTVTVWETSSQRRLVTLFGHTGTVRGVALSADGRLLASGAEDEAVRLWDPGSGRPLATLHGHAGGIFDLAVSASGHRVASAGEDGTVRVWDVGTGRPVATLAGHSGGVNGVTLSADGTLVVCGSFDGTLRHWQPSTEQPPTILHGHVGMVWGVALAANAPLLASGGLDGTVRLWDAATGSWLRTGRADRRYERLDITGLVGITGAQRTALLALGAIDHSE